jgi:hypothetical protein
MWHSILRSSSKITTVACTYHHLLHRPPSIRLERHESRHNGHDNVERRTNVDRHRRVSIGVCGHEGRHNAHDAVARDCDAIAGRTVRGGQDLGGVRVERAVVYVEEEVDRTGETQVLSGTADLGVAARKVSFRLRESHSEQWHIREEEDHRDDGTEDHSTTTLEVACIGHQTTQNRAEDTCNVHDRVVAPCSVVAAVSKVRTTRLEVVRQENVVERVGEADEGPAQPYERRAEAELAGDEETRNMGPCAGERETLLLGTTLYDATVLELL